MAKTVEWQHQGGILEIPEGWFVSGANFDTDEPTITIYNGASFNSSEERKLPVPKSLAYYLSTHNCGSEEMRARIKDNGRRQVQEAIKEALGL